jgi:hypothetical protein
MFETLSRGVCVSLVAILQNAKSTGGVEILILTRPRMQKKLEMQKTVAQSLFTVLVGRTPDAARERGR